MPEFHNPYHFVSACSEPGPGALTLQMDTQSGRQPKPWPDHLTHDRFVAKTLVNGNQEDVFSGRIVCQSIIKDLLALGANQIADDVNPRDVSLFKINGKYALAGSSLRGMLSSIAEAASNSTLRILGDHNLSLKPEGRPPTNPGGTLHEFFRKLDPELVPLQEGDGRKSLTIAEQLFGVVEERPRNASNSKRPVLSLASRVRISNALAHGEPPTIASRQITKILGSPKYRYPSFHFDLTQKSEFIPRDQLKLNQGHVPKGRKFYLHRKKLTDADWVTNNENARRNQKALVAPLSSGEFWFHVDFDNLSLLELELVCYALRPTSSFMHQLGLGKPLGLGKLEINPMGLFLVNRATRYSSQGLLADRYSRVWRDACCLSSNWPALYQAREAGAPVTEPAAPLPRALADAYRKRIEEKHMTLWPILQSIELLGDPEKVSHPVHYPQLPNQDLEQNLFKWFQYNESQNGNGQFLRALTKANTCDFKEIPTLDRNTKLEPPMPSCWVAGQPPARLLPLKELSPADYEGMADVPFLVAEKKRNGKIQFEIEIAGKVFPGFLPPNDLNLLLQSHRDLNVGDFLPLSVVKFNAGYFQLRFMKPPTA